MRGVYVDAEDDVEVTVLRHAVAVRIAQYLYSRAYLTIESRRYYKDCICTEPRN